MLGEAIDDGRRGTTILYWCPFNKTRQNLRLLQPFWSFSLYLRRTSIFAVVLILVLRSAIGWQLFYEGLWKIKTQSTPYPWTSAGYLKNSQGPMRSTFRKMAGDPNELDWLDVDKMSTKWTTWQDRFAQHFKLDDRQVRRLANYVQGPKEFVSDAGKIESVPEGVNLDSVSVIRFDAEKKRLVVDGKKHLSGKEYTKLLQSIPEGDDPSINAFREQLNKVYQRSSNLSYLEQLRAALLGDSDVAGMQTKDGGVQQIGELQKYRNMLEDYETEAAAAKQDFQHEHLQKMWADVQAQRVKLVGPIKALEQSMHDDAQKLLTVEQLKRGKLPTPWTTLRISDALTIAGLTILGFCLMTGLLTRFSAIMAAIMLFSFYLAMPPLPGLPEQPGPEHSLIVNKNLIEVFALLAIAAFPSGYWFGLDAVLGKFFRKILGSRKEDDGE